ncbi:hypothetical protein SO802_005939 [Lithocarpus litseifolius]|uniref:RNase H type-1 domain-containing protein n=1 Tax=Lithocarpus litseifolius TaxID=425828 RepID=A0AAW2DP86_9ROSI
MRYERKLGDAINENLIATKTGLAHTNSLIMCKLAEVFTMGISIGNPCSSSQKKPKAPTRTYKKQARKRDKGSKIHHWLPIKHPPKITSPVAIDSIYWQPPQSEVFKVNCNGAVFSESNKLGLGVAVRNSNGQVIALLSQHLNQAYNPLKWRSW